MIGRVMLAAALLLAMAGQPALLVHNATESMPPGFYRLCLEPPAVGRIIRFRLPERIHGYVRLRMGHVDAGWTILKPVVAEEGDYVCVTDDGFSLNGQRLAGVPLTDSLGNPMPVWRECRRLEAGEFFVFSDRVERSLDSRYLGPIRAEDILGVYVPLWTWGGMRHGGEQ